MFTPEQLEETLRGLALDVNAVHVSVDGSRYIAVVTSQDFEGVDEGERQRIVWQHLLDHVAQRDLRHVEFVFTYTPNEYDDYFTQAPARS